MKVVETKYGKIAGVEDDSYVVFRGVPYAKPPVGDFRWKAPVAPDSFDGIYQADKFAAICPQRKQEVDGPQMGFNYGKEFYANSEYEREHSEDCLYLNIWIPSNAKPGDDLPVAFYIHGGAFMGGYSSEEEFDGESYAKKGIILVTIGYRLGVFGFLAHPWLCEENEKNICGNYGILDQIAALNWVYENIDNFGGNPDNITVFGQSAGSMSTQVLISSDITEDKISKAILQSGISCEEEMLLTPTLEEEMEYGKRFVEITGSTNIDMLRAMSSEELLKYQEKFAMECFEKGWGLVFVPAVDGYVLKDTVKDVYKNGLMKKIPYITGFVTNDIGQTEEDRNANRAGLIEDECRRWAMKTSKVTEQPTFVYSFTHDLPGDESGAFHSSELWYMFGTYDRCWRPMKESDVKLSEQMINYWTDFMKYGNPDEKNNTWIPYNEKNKYIKVFN